MSLRSMVVSQFSAPSGLLGHVAGWVMANRPSNKQRNIWTVELLALTRDDRVLEIGCGPGLSLEACLRTVNSGQVVGVDRSEVMLEQAKSRNREAVREGRLKLLKGDIHDVSPQGPFTKVFSVNVVQFFPDQVEVFSRCRTLMADKGVFAATYQPRNKNPTTADAMRMADRVSRNLLAAGFVEIRADLLPLQPAPAVCVLATKADAATKA